MLWYIILVNIHQPVVQDLARELKKLWDMKIVVIPIVIGVLGTTPKMLPKQMTDIGVKTNIGEFQKTIILNTARILRKVLEIWSVLLTTKL